MNVNRFVDHIPQVWFMFAYRKEISAEKLFDLFLKSIYITQREEDDFKRVVVGTDEVYEASYENLQSCIALIGRRIQGAHCPSPERLLEHVSTRTLVLRINMIDNHLESCPTCMADAKQLGYSPTIVRSVRGRRKSSQ